MLVDIQPLLQEHLEHCRSFFARPTDENGGYILEPKTVEAHFGYEVVLEGVYLVGSPNTANFLREVIPDGMRHSGRWCEHRDYGTAASVEEILVYAKPAELDQACVVLVVPVDEIPPKSGPWIGPRDKDGHPEPGKVVLDWSLVPIDPAKLEAALTRRLRGTPAP